MQMNLPAEWVSWRATTLRYRLYALSDQFVRHARQRTRRLNAGRRAQLDEAIWSIRNSVLS